MSTILHALRPEVPGWLTDRPIAHRGLHDAEAPENTMAAFEAAAAAGYPIELDVHLSRDGEIVVFHDHRLDRLTEHRGRVSQRDWSELRAMTVGGTRERIPSLPEVVARIDGRVPIVVEIKNTARAGPLELAVASLLRSAPGRYTVQSFNPWTLLWFSRNAPTHPRGLLSCDFTDEDLPLHEKLLLQHLAPAPFVRPTYIGYDLRCLPHWAPTAARALGLPLLAWTVRTLADLTRATDLADNIIFESLRPSLKVKSGT